MKFLLDADVPISLGDTLRQAGHDVRDVRQEVGAPLDDVAVIHLAQRDQRILITRDVGIGNLLHYPLTRQHGRILLRFHRATPQQLTAAVVALIRETPETDLYGALAVVQPGRWRFWRR